MQRAAGGEALRPPPNPPPAVTNNNKDNKQQTTNNKQQTTNNKQQTTNNKQQQQQQQQATSFQNEHFVRGLLNFSRNKLPKRAFCARPLQLFKQQASKTSISCEASSTFQATSFQNEHFVSVSSEASSTFQATTSKTSISCEASSTFQATNFQTEHFVQGLFNFSNKKLPKSCACHAKRNHFGSLSSPARPPARRRAQI